MQYTVFCVNPTFAVIRQLLRLLGCSRRMQPLQTIVWWTMPGVEPKRITSFCSLRGSYTGATWRTPCAQVPHHIHFTADRSLIHELSFISYSTFPLFRLLHLLTINVITSKTLVLPKLSLLTSLKNTLF